jgi:anti-sigma B factor antagonist
MAPVDLDPALRRPSKRGTEEDVLTDGEHRDGNTPALRKEPVLAVYRIEDGIVVRLAGELDLYNAPTVRDALAQAAADGPQRMIVDLSEVEFIDSTGLGVLIEARTKLPDRKGFILAGPGLETRRALEISGLDRHFAVHGSVDEALAGAS